MARVHGDAPVVSVVAAGNVDAVVIGGHAAAAPRGVERGHHLPAVVVTVVALDGLHHQGVRASSLGLVGMQGSMWMRRRGAGASSLAWSPNMHAPSHLQVVLSIVTADSQHRRADDTEPDEGPGRAHLGSHAPHVRRLRSATTTTRTSLLRQIGRGCPTC